MYESRHAPLLPFGRFLRRMLIHAAVAMSMMGASLLAGMAGYMHFERLEPRDAFLNAAMLLGGMGPIKTDLSSAGKVFAGCYALYCGLFFIAIVSVLLAPLLHRLMHKLHWDDKAGR